MLADPEYPVEYGRRDVESFADVDLDGPVTVCDRGATVAMMAEGAVFHDPRFESICASMGPVVELVEMDSDINDAAFANAMVARLMGHVRHR